jgi:hypothetical protein
LVQLGGQPDHIRLEPPRSAIGYGPQFIEHGGDVSRHTDLIGLKPAPRRLGYEW